ncbi:MAG: NlpC/P60 family protein [Candidatus Komeilibacteria bacterium]
MIINRKMTYLSFIENSVNSRMFCDVYYSNGEELKNITQNGKMSCAVFVSSLLYLLKLVRKTHSTVKSTVKDMKENGWLVVEKPQKGDVLVWDYNKSGHMHIGFYLSDEVAVSNSTVKRKIHKHNPTYNNKRKIIEILRHSF